MTIKPIVLLVFLIILVSSNAFANDFGTYQGSIDTAQTMEDAEETIKRSQAFRSEFETQNRAIASFSEEDKKWAKEFDDLMEDDSDVDYLGMVEKELL